MSSLFSPIKIKSIELKNRIVGIAYVRVFQRVLMVLLITGTWSIWAAGLLVVPG
jgi:hypothetical protein